MSLAKTIEIYLLTGDASKVSQARITTEAIRIVYVARTLGDVFRDAKICV